MTEKTGMSVSIPYTSGSPCTWTFTVNNMDPPPPWEGESNAHIVVGLAEKEYWKGCCCTQRCSTHCAKPLLGICRDLTDLIMLMLNF